MIHNIKVHFYQLLISPDLVTSWHPHAGLTCLVFFFKCNEGGVHDEDLYIPNIASFINYESVNVASNLYKETNRNTDKHDRNKR